MELQRLCHVYSSYFSYPKYSDPSRLVILRTLPLLCRFKSFHLEGPMILRARPGSGTVKPIWYTALRLASGGASASASHFCWGGAMAQKRLKKIHDDLVNYVTCRYFALDLHYLTFTSQYDLEFRSVIKASLFLSQRKTCGFFLSTVSCQLGYSLLQLYSLYLNHHQSYLRCLQHTKVQSKKSNISKE